MLALLVIIISMVVELSSFMLLVTLVVTLSVAALLLVGLMEVLLDSSVLPDTLVVELVP